MCSPQSLSHLFWKFFLPANAPSSSYWSTMTITSSSLLGALPSNSLIYDYCLTTLSLLPTYLIVHLSFSNCLVSGGISPQLSNSVLYLPLLILAPTDLCSALATATAIRLIIPLFMLLFGSLLYLLQVIPLPLLGFAQLGLYSTSSFAATAWLCCNLPTFIDTHPSPLALLIIKKKNQKATKVLSLWIFITSGRISHASTTFHNAQSSLESLITLPSSLNRVSFIFSFRRPLVYLR